MKYLKARLLRYFAIRTSTECFGWAKWTDFSSLTPEHTGTFEGKTCSSDKICQKILFKCKELLQFFLSRKVSNFFRKKIREDSLHINIDMLEIYFSNWKNVSN